MRVAAVRAVVLGALLLSACADRGPEPDFVVRGVGLIVDSEAPFTAQPDLADRVERTVDAALAYWGGGWEQLGGMSITLSGSRYVDCGGVPGAIGCFDGDIRVSTTDVDAAFACVEQTVLVHEIGHAVIGDRDHTDPRWMDFTPVADALAGLDGYDGRALTPCQPAVSVWRHPPPHHH